MRTSQTLCTLSLVAMLAAVIANDAIGQEDRTPKGKNKNARAARPTEVIGVWTCAMHPKVRAAKDGKCPICGMHLIVATKSAKPRARLLSLDDMLAIALQYNPDIRAAQAQVEAARAGLDRTRLDVLKQVMKFREKWGSRGAELKAAEQELLSAQQALAKQPDSKLAAKMLQSAQERISAIRARLAEVEAELPFLLGRAPNAPVPPRAARVKLLTDELLPKAQALLRLRTREYTVGEADISTVANAMRQIVQLELQLADTKAKKRSALESQKQLLLNMRSIAMKRYQAATATQGDVLAVELEIAKLDLQLLEFKD